MPLRIYVITAIFSLLPIAELRGGIPFAIANGVPFWAAYLFCVFFNLLISPFLLLFLGTVHEKLKVWNWYDRIVGKLIDRARSKVEGKVEKYGYIGIALFVAVPLPITGAYTGTLGAWVLGLDTKKSILTVSLGVLTAGIIVTTVTVLGIEALSIFIKHG